MTLDLLPTFPEDQGNVITEFSCNPGAGSRSEHSIIMKLGNALQLCYGAGKWDQKLIGQQIKIK